MAKKILESLKSRIADKYQAMRARDMADVRQLVVLIAEDDDGYDVDIDADYFVEVLARQGFCQADIEHNVGILSERKRLKRIAAGKVALQAKAVELEEKAEAFDLAEGQRHRKALADLRQLREDARLASDAAIAAVGAESDLLATAAPQPDIATLNAELTKVVRRIEAVREKLDPSVTREGDRLVSSTVWGDVERSPGRLQAQLRRMLDDRRPMGYSVERQKELARMLESADAAVERCQGELAKLESQHAELVERMKPDPDWALKPENFVLKRHQLTADEERRRHASKFGFGNQDRGFEISRD